jgi:hypothetical protein
MIETCPECGGTAILLQSKTEVRDVPDLGDPTRTDRLTVKIEEFRCQEQSCEHEFEKIIREPAT